MRSNRGLATLAASVACLFGVVSVAQASTTTAPLSIKLSPGKTGTAKKPVGQKLAFDLKQTTDDGTSPPTFSTVVVSFGQGLRFNPAKFPSCTKATLDSKGPSGCPKGSKVGTGSALALIGGSPGEPAPTTTETLKVTAFNGGGTKFEMYLDGDTPANIKQALEGTLIKGGGDFPYQLTVPVPANLQQPVPGLYAPVVDFQVTVGATLTKTKTKKVKGKKKKVKTTTNYIETIGCTAGKWLFKADITYVNVTTGLSATTEQSC